MMILLKAEDVWAINDGLQAFLKRVADRDTPMPVLHQFIHGFVRSEVRSRYLGPFEVHVFLRRTGKGYDIDWHLTGPIEGRDPDNLSPPIPDA